MSKIKTAMILVGGEGNRLAEIFPGQPTSLVPIFGKTLFVMVIRRIKNMGP
jgi:dTDP-glucose pyrophosphorylase